MKQCAKCKQLKSLTSFHKKLNGYHSYCKQCRSATERNSDTNRQASWASKVKSKYGLTINEYNEMRESFESCSICGSINKLVLDHNHTTGRLREFICSNCNLALGLLNEDPERMERMIAYVRKHEREDLNEW